MVRTKPVEIDPIEEARNVLKQRKKYQEAAPILKTDFDRPSKFGLCAGVTFFSAFILMIYFVFFRNSITN